MQIYLVIYIFIYAAFYGETRGDQNIRLADATRYCRMFGLSEIVLTFRSLVPTLALPQLQYDIRRI